MRNSQKFREEFARLNNSQREAAETIEGPLLVVAGPGTGKTQTLALRLANILATTHAKPWNLLALTFTESAAINLKKRLASIIGPDAYGIVACTFHAFAARLIALFPAEFSAVREAQPLNELAQFRILQNILDHGKFEFLRPIGASDFYTRTLAKTISTLKREGCTPPEFEKILAREALELDAMESINPRTGKKFGKVLDAEKRLAKNRELARVYARYQETLAERGLVDFDDLILSVVEVLAGSEGGHRAQVAGHRNSELGTRANSELHTKNEEPMTDDKRPTTNDEITNSRLARTRVNSELLLAYLQENFLYVTVDEFQDTNGAQEAILRAYASFDRKPNLCVVGDDDQSIYRFQGANLANILDFTTNYEDVKIVTLTRNYRSTQAILDASRSLIERNSERLVNKIDGLTKNLIAEEGIKNKATSGHFVAGRNKASEELITDNRQPTTNDKLANSEILNTKYQIPNTKTDMPRVLEFTTAEDETAYVVGEIQNLLAQKVPAEEIVVLYRNRRDGDLFASYLQRAGIDLHRLDGQDALATPRVGELVNLLRAVNEPNDSASLFSALGADFIGIHEADLFRLARAADRFDGILDFLADETKLETLAIATEYRPALKFENPEALKLLGKKFRNWCALARTTNLSELAEVVLAESGLAQKIAENQEHETIEALAAFLDFVRQFSAANPEASLKTLLADLATMRKEKLALSLPARPHAAVTLATAHRAKGLEWQHVFVVKCADEVWGGGVKRELIKLPKLIERNENLETMRNEELRIKNEEINPKSEIRNSKQARNSKLETLNYEIPNTKYQIPNTTIEEERRLFYVAMTRAREGLTLSIAQNYDGRALTPSRFLAEIDPNLLERTTPKVDEKLKMKLVLPIRNPRVRGTRPQSATCPPKPDGEGRISNSTNKFLASLVESFRLSPTALNNYLACPRKFLFQNLLKLPIAPDPEARAGAIFGSAIHAGLEAFFREFKLTTKLPKFEVAFTAIKKNLAREPLTRVQRERFETDVTNAAQKWLEAQNTKLRPPLDVEFNFGKHELHLDAIPLVGKVDRIDLVNETQNQVAFVDYKSQKPYSRNAILGKTADASGDAYRQLVFYYLLAELDARFVYDVASVTLVFLRPNERGEFVEETFVVAQTEIETLKTTIRETFARIQNLEFECDENADCSKCGFKAVCKK